MVLHAELAEGCVARRGDLGWTRGAWSSSSSSASGMIREIFFFRSPSLSQSTTPLHHLLATSPSQYLSSPPNTALPPLTMLFPRPSLPFRLAFRLHLRQRLPTSPHRTLIAPPTPGSGPLMERRSDRALPSVTPSRRWLRTLPLFLVLLGASTLAIFNYQKSSSSVVSSTLYALRMSPKARAVLGDEIYFRAKIPWIMGEMNQLHGRIDIKFWVKGKEGEGLMRFRSLRRERLGEVSYIQ